jgi:hypothetical protein
MRNAERKTLNAKRETPNLEPGTWNLKKHYLCENIRNE